MTLSHTNLSGGFVSSVIYNSVIYKCMALSYINLSVSFVSIVIYESMINHIRTFEVVLCAVFL